MMAKLVDTIALKRLFQQGVNIIDYIRRQDGAAAGDSTAVLYSYDLQAGTYTEALNNPDYVAFKIRRARIVAELVDAVSPESVLDVGTGEATSLLPLLQHLSKPPTDTLAFDISLSRVLYARKHLVKHGFSARLFTADMMHIPLADESIDVVLTYHAAEPNGGREPEILKELLRVARRRLIMMEPSYELGTDSTKARIERLGYVRGLPDEICKQGHVLARHELLESWRPENQTALMVVDKEPRHGQSLAFHSPISGAPLEQRDGFLYSRQDGFAFPVIAGIACLNPENGVLATRLDEALA